MPEKTDQPDKQKPARPSGALAKRDRRIASLEQELADLNNYLQARKDQWVGLQADLARYKDAVVGMEIVIRGHDERMEEKEREKAGLNARVLELERRCAQLEGRLRERAERPEERNGSGPEPTHGSSQDPVQSELLTEANRRCEELERRVRALSAESNRLETENSAHSELIARLEADLEAKQQRVERRNGNLTLIRQNLRAVPNADRHAESRNGSAEQLIDPAELFGTDCQESLAVEVKCIDIGQIEDDVASAGANAAAAAHQARRRRMLPLHDPDGPEFEIPQGRVTIGRSRRSDICIRDDSVSRNHACLYEAKDGLIIEDAASTNGILVNNEPVERAVLQDGDIVSLGGRYDLKYVEDFQPVGSLSDPGS